MKKIWTIIPMLLLAAACSDDENGYTAPPALSDEDSNISVPALPAGWAPGMDYEPYDTLVPTAPGSPVNILITYNESRSANQLAIANNEAWIWSFQKYGKAVMQKENVKSCYFPNHSDVHIYMGDDETDLNPERVSCDIVVFNQTTTKLAVAQRYMQQLEETFGEDYPLVIVSGGDYNNTFSDEAWNLCLRIGGLNWKEDVIPAFPAWEVGEVLTDEQKVYYSPGNVLAAYALQNVDGFGRSEDWIVVGNLDGNTNKPGNILQDRWLCAPYNFNVGDASVNGSYSGAAYVAKIAAEVKRRLPGFTNAEIADLLFSTADRGDAATFGRGIINPVALWEKVATLENKVNN